MSTLPLLEAFASHWWVLLIRGILAVLFGIMAFAMSGITLTTLIVLYGIYAFADGLTSLWIGGSTRSWGHIVGGIVGVIAAIYAIVYPGMTAVILLLCLPCNNQ